MIIFFDTNLQLAKYNFHKLYKLEDQRTEKIIFLS